MGSEASPDLSPRLPHISRHLSGLPNRVLDCLEKGREFFFSLQRESGHWCAELQSNPAIAAEYVFLQQILGLDLKPKRERLLRYLVKMQFDDGSWGIAEESDGGDVSTTAEVYLGLRILGLEISDETMLRAEKYILDKGGLEAMRIFTRINFALFGLVPWSAIPAISPEFIFLPPRSPVNIYALSSWARGTMIPLFVIAHHKPVFALPNGRSEGNGYLDHLWRNPRDKKIPYAPELLSLLKKNGFGWEIFFGAADSLLKHYERFRIRGLRKMAVKKCMDWILSRQEKSGDWAGIFPPMVNSILALHLEGYGLDSDPIRRGLEAIENFSWEDSEGLRVQACVSPVWDTALGLTAMIDTKIPTEDERLAQAAGWLVRHEIRADYGDWKVSRPDLPTSGWSFEYHNTWYPDIDDTAAVLLALMKQDPRGEHNLPSVLRGLDWTLGMQNRDGGFAAFDVDNDKLFLNKIPFSDMDSLCDTSCPDITGRVLEACGLFLSSYENKVPAATFAGLKKRIMTANGRAMAYLERSQEREGSWYGRWGVNYIYGTGNVLCGLASMGVSETHPLVCRALHWLESIQNKDDGWGESVESYENRKKMGRGPSTASQTAWALMGLLSYLPPDSIPIVRGIEWLVRTQSEATQDDVFEGGAALPSARGSTWKESAFTGTGFPAHFYLRYHFYRHYFPLMALGRYLRARET